MSQLVESLLNELTSDLIIEESEYELEDFDFGDDEEDEEFLDINYDQVIEEDHIEPWEN